MEKYDSTKDTIAHKIEVSRIIDKIVIPEFEQRSKNHDLSKLKSPEREVYDEYIPQLKAVKYGSPEHKAVMEKMSQNGLNHHYQYNSHHPEHFNNGVNDMSLFDIFEMVVDWIAASKCGKDVDKFKSSLDINAKRFGLSDQLKGIILNTYLDIISEK